MESIGIYYGSATAARDAGELDMYRASNAENRRTRDIIDAAISEYFDGCRLPAAALESILIQSSPERVALVLAATLDDKQYDGRFSSENRAWAAGIRRPEGEPESIRECRCWYVCRSHSTILNGLVNQFRRLCC